MIRCGGVTGNYALRRWLAHVTFSQTRRTAGVLTGLSSTVRCASTSSTGLPIAPEIQQLKTSRDASAAREWLDSFQRAKLLREHADITFSRSSGPGGQNVNKVNTKASLRVALHSPWIPLWVRDDLRRSQYFASASQSIVMASTAYRSQAQNVNDVLNKLHSFVSEAVAKTIKNEPTEEQKMRVKALEQIERRRRRDLKDKRSELKKSRSKRWEE